MEGTLFFINKNILQNDCTFAHTLNWGLNREDIGFVVAVHSFPRVNANKCIIFYTSILN